MRKLLSLIAALLLCSVIAFSQTTRTVSGKVTDEKGDPIPFATVAIKGTKNATIADANGLFSIKLNAGDVLVVSAQGVDKKEVTPGAGDFISVEVTKSNSALQEVVITGAYNTKKTARSTSYNAQVVTGEQLNTIRQTNIANALAGKVS